MESIRDEQPGGKPGASKVRLEWAKHAEALADLVLARIAVRRDVYGAYRPDGGQYTAHEPLTRELLVRHFRGEITVGVHSTSTDGRCRSIVWDIDAHDDTADPEANRDCAHRAAEILIRGDFRPLICDSNGRGGYHVRAFLKKPVPAAVAYWICERVKSQLATEGFAPCEAFPKQPELSLDCPYGNWVRLPGKHHKREHWTRIYDPDAGRWLEGEGAVLRLLKISGDQPEKALRSYKANDAESREKAGGNGKAGAHRRRSDAGKPTEEELRSALDALPSSWADDYGGERGNTAWLGVGMALHDWDESRGLDLWKEFSRRCVEKYAPADCDEKWATFTAGGGLTAKTIFKAAIENGWRGNGHGATSEDSWAKGPSANGTADGDGKPAAEPETSGDARGDIYITADFHEVVDRAAAALVAHPEIYERGGSLARVVGKEASDPAEKKGIKRAAGAPQIVILNQVSARTLISRLARFWAFDGRAGKWARKPPPRDVAEAVVSLGLYPTGRALTAIVEAPTLRPDGSLIVMPGYDPMTGLLYLPNARYPAIPDSPTIGEIQRAASDLLFLVHDFPFKADSDRAAWLALVLTLVARGAIVGPTPAFLFSANVAGSGKTLLAGLAGRIATGRPPAFDGYTADDAEMEKRLGAVSIVGDPFLLFDNAANGSAVGCPALDRAILIPTDGTYRARILGKSEMSPPVPWRTTIAITGNNLGTRDDALRRFVPSFLLSPIERPETRDPAAYAVTRETGLSLDDYVMRERPRLVAAALTILRGYVAAGRPRGVKDGKPLTPMDFPRWDALVRQAVYHAIGVDPCGSRDVLEANDETTLERHRVVAAWKDLCEALKKNVEGITAREAADAMNDNATSEPYKAIRDAFPKANVRANVPGGTAIDSNKLGYTLRRYRDAVTPSGTLRAMGKEHQATLWAVHSAGCLCDICTGRMGG